MKKLLNRNFRKGERGNVLFLILIAVALFAALSYAVTSSSRSGGGNANEETNLVNSAQITQYPSSVRTSLIRMMVSGGTDPTQFNFDQPTNFAAACTAAPANCVFHPTGGGATHVTAPAEVMTDGAQGEWFFSSEYEITDIGTGEDDIIAFLPGIKTSICRKLNSELGITGGTDTDADGVPAAGATAIPAEPDNMDAGGTTANLGIDTTGATAAQTIGAPFSGQPFGCFDAVDANTTNTDDLIYYHVLMER